MKNHYKIHVQHFDDFDQEKDESAVKCSGKEGAKKIHQSMMNPMTIVGGACKIEMLDWLRTDFDRVDIATSSMTNDGKPSVQQDDDWVHLD